MNALERTSRDSQLGVDPPIQLLDRKAMRDLTKDVTSVQKIKSRSGGCVEPFLTGLLLVAAAIALIVVGAHTLFAPLVGGVLLAVGIAKLIQAGYRLYIDKKIEKVYDDATYLRLCHRFQKQSPAVEMTERHDPRGRRSFAQSQPSAPRQAPAQRSEGRGYIPVSDDT
ncbi:MAG: hypothetical protein K1X28_05810 [Parachlamydiales bacterium]|nr:hypothetical protein [Parachlamydiales bacterium]